MLKLLVQLCHTYQKSWQLKGKHNVSTKKASEYEEEEKQAGG
jgi:hypothetical protein